MKCITYLYQCIANTSFFEGLGSSITKQQRKTIRVKKKLFYCSLEGGENFVLSSLKRVCVFVVNKGCNKMHRTPAKKN